MAEKSIAKVSDVGVGSSKNFSHEGEDAILVNVDGSLFAYANRCTHLGCSVIFKGGVLLCPCHASQFDPKTGAVLKGPAKKPLKSIKIEVKGGVVYVE